MKLGLGLFRESVTEENFKFARQAGATHLVVHMTNYHRGKDPKLSSGSDTEGWGVTTGKGRLWSTEELVDMKKAMNAHGLVWEAIENFDPAFWYDVLLDGPEKKRQIEDLKQVIRNMGKAGIPIIGYNFSLAGVWGWTKAPIARGGAMAVRFDVDMIDVDQPIPAGMVWNMIYDTEAAEGTVRPVSSEELWQRVEFFLREILPVAEENGVRMAAHPDDPPAPSLRGTARLVNQPHKYQRLLDLAPSPANGIDFCMGSVQEMSEGDLYEALDTYSRQKKIFYGHFRNVKGKVPRYTEVFVDEGDIDMLKALRILEKNNFDGVLIPDHTPEMSCDAPWHAGMAHALGYMRGLLTLI